MVSEDEIEEGIKGTIEKHIHYPQVSVAIGYDTRDGDSEEHSIAYIYNIPKQEVDRGFLAVRASENGGSNPEVAEPSPFEYVVGFDCFELNEDEIREVCEETISDIGYSADETEDESTLAEDVTVSVQEPESIDDETESDKQTDESDTINIDLSDEFE